jgi:hypothetical protein
MPTKAPGNVTSPPDGSGLVQAGQECQPGVVTRDQDPGLTRLEPDRQRGLDLSTAPGQGIQGPTPGESGGGHGTADEDPENRHHGYLRERDEAAEKQGNADGDGTRPHRSYSPPPAALGNQAATRGHRRHRQHHHNEADREPPRAQDRRDEQAHDRQLDGRTPRRAEVGAPVLQAAHAVDQRRQQGEGHDDHGQANVSGCIVHEQE